MANGKPNITLIGIKISDKTIAPYSTVIWDRVERFNEISSLISRKSVLISDNIHGQLEFLIKDSRVLLYMEDGEPTKKDVKVVRNIEEVLNLLRRRYDACYVMGGTSLFTKFFPYAYKMLLAPVGGTLHNDSKYPQFNPEEWKELEKTESSPIKHFSEYVRIQTHVSDVPYALYQFSSANRRKEDLC